MTDRIKAKLYLVCLDKILAGEKDIAPIEDAEVDELLRLAQKMIAADFSVNAEIRERLRKKLLERIDAEGELSDEDLAYATAGLAEHAAWQICPICGARVSTFQGKCPFCR